MTEFTFCEKLLAFIHHCGVVIVPFLYDPSYVDAYKKLFDQHLAAKESQAPKPVDIDRSR